MLHVGYENGFVPGGKLVFKAGSSDGDYHSEMNHKSFQRWLTEKLIPNAPENTVLVLDNAACHNVQVDGCPTMATRKAGLAGPPQHHLQTGDGKAELLQLCKQNARPVYVADGILGRHGTKLLDYLPTMPSLTQSSSYGGTSKASHLNKHLATFSFFLKQSP